MHNQGDHFGHSPKSSTAGRTWDEFASIREELLNSGRVRVFVEKDLRSELREERISTQEFSRPEYIRKVANEISADFMMVGSIKDQKERSRDLKKIINYYQTTLELIDIESGEVVWIQTEEIEKRASRR